MIVEKWHVDQKKNPIGLWTEPPGFDPLIKQNPPTITPYLLKGKNRGCVLVFPGGGYTFKALHEAEVVAKWLNLIEISSFVLDYRVSPYRAPIPFYDAARAVRTVRARAGEWGIDPQKIGVLGFSAGGHLAACMATMYDAGQPGHSDPVERMSSRPDAAVLCYPVISLNKPYYEPNSLKALMGYESANPDMLAKWSPDENVKPDVPPVFLWHTARDEQVPFENSMYMASAVNRAGGRVELHVYPEGEHGLSLAQEYDAGRWKAACEVFLKRTGFV